MQKPALFLFGFLLLPACATTYQEATRANYVGNGQYEIRASGNGYTHAEDVNRFLYRRAFETCQAEKKGFRILTQSDMSRTEASFTKTGDTVSQSNSYLPGTRMIIQCEGPVDPRMAAEVERARREAQED